MKFNSEPCAKFLHLIFIILISIIVKQNILKCKLINIQVGGEGFLANTARDMKGK